MGTIINAVAVLAGSFIGAFMVRGLARRYLDTVMQGIALVVLTIGLSMALKTEEPLFIILAIGTGGVIGEWLKIEDLLDRLADAFERAFGKGRGKVSEAFITATLVYCVGPMAIMGALENGLTGNYDTLLAKSALDGISSVIFATSFGPGVALSAIPITLYQGSITLLAGQAAAFLTEAVVREMTATGGVLILAIGLNLLGVVKLRVANMLPAIFVIPAIVVLAGWF